MNECVPTWIELKKYIGQCSECEAERLIADCAELGELCYLCFKDAIAINFPEEEPGLQ